MRTTDILNGDARNIMTYRLAAWSSVVLLVYSLLTIAIVAFIGGPPQTVIECFEMLHNHRLAGLLRLDVLTVFVMPLYFVLFYGLYEALKQQNKSTLTVSTLFVFVGVGLFLSAPSVFSYLRLSDLYYAATDEITKQRYLTAAEAIMAADIWNGTGPRVGGLLVQTGATAISFVMLRHAKFRKVTSIVGITTHGLDLLHMIVGFFVLQAANMMMAVAGVLYLFWFALLGKDLFGLSKANKNDGQTETSAN